MHTVEGGFHLRHRLAEQADLERVNQAHVGQRSNLFRYVLADQAGQQGFDDERRYSHDPKLADAPIVVHTKALLGAVHQHLLSVERPVVWVRHRVASHAHRTKQIIALSYAVIAFFCAFIDRSKLVVASVVLEKVMRVVVLDEDGQTIRSVHVVDRVDQIWMLQDDLEGARQKFECTSGDEKSFLRKL